MNISHKFLVDTEIWYPKEFGTIIGVPAKELDLFMMRYLKIIEYRIPPCIEYDSTTVEN